MVSVVRPRQSLSQHYPSAALQLPTKARRRAASPRRPTLPEPFVVTRRSSLLGGLAAIAAALRAPRVVLAPEGEDLCSVEPQSSAGLVQPLLRPNDVMPTVLPRKEDVVQGNFSDCYFLAALIGVLNRHPWLIKNRLRYLGQRSDGTHDYSVCLLWFNQANPVRPYREWVCVSSKVSPHSASGALWVALFEKAFAKFNDRHHILRTDAPGYDALEVGGRGEGFAVLTGRQSTKLIVQNRTFEPQAGFPTVPVADFFRQNTHIGYVYFYFNPERIYDDRYDNATQTYRFDDGCKLRQRLGSQRCTFIRPDGRSSVLYVEHAYTVVDVNACGDLLLRNPHGFNLRTLDNKAAPLLSKGNRGPAEFWLEKEYFADIVSGVRMGRVA